MTVQPGSSSKSTKRSTKINKSRKGVSKIPVLSMKPKSSLTPSTKTSTADLRRSKRNPLPLKGAVPSPKKVCCPKNLLVDNLKPVIRLKDENMLNLIVNSPSGLLNESTKYATEFNSINGEGIPLPTTVDEQISVPIRSGKRARNKNLKKMAIVQGILNNISSSQTLSEGEKRVTLGFYSFDDYKRFIKKKDDDYFTSKVGKKMTKTVHWANQLEW